MIATLWTVMRKELRECFRDRRTLVNSLLIGPVLAPVFFMLVLKLALAGVLEIAPEAPLMLVPSLSQHLLIQGLIRGEPLPATWSVIAAASCLLLGVALAWLAGRLYRREAILG